MNRQAISDLGRAALGAKQHRPPVSPEAFADVLKPRPGSSARMWAVESDGLQAIAIAEVGQVQGQTPAVKVKRAVVLGIQAVLGEEPVPLGGGRFGSIGEVERGDDLTALPAAIARGGRAS